VNNSTNIHPFKIFAFLFAILLVTFFSCRKEKPELAEEVNPCDGANEVNGNFIIEEMTTVNTNFALYTITDTIYKNKSVRFTALEDDAEYTWYIGTEVLHTKEVTRYFSDTWSGVNIPITLVTKKKSNKLCFPDDDGYDSITKFFHVSNLPIWNIPDAILGPVEGSFRMHSPHLPDSFDINMRYLKPLKKIRLIKLICKL
jgi:hypothetical protein